MELVEEFRIFAHRVSYRARQRFVIVTLGSGAPAEATEQSSGVCIGNEHRSVEDIQQDTVRGFRSDAVHAEQLLA